jgi:hypothetical protein
MRRALDRASPYPRDFSAATNLERSRTAQPAAKLDRRMLKPYNTSIEPCGKTLGDTPN